MKDAVKKYSIFILDPMSDLQTLEIQTTLSIMSDFQMLSVVLVYLKGSWNWEPNQKIVEWIGQYNCPNAFDAGDVDIGGGERTMPAQLRNAGLGSLLISMLIVWAKQLPSAPVANIYLSKDDARNEDAQKMRNHFWKKFGFQFESEDGEISGISTAMSSDQLIRGNLTSYTKNGWHVMIDPQLAIDFSP